MSSRAITQTRQQEVNTPGELLPTLNVPAGSILPVLIPTVSSMACVTTISALFYIAGKLGRGISIVSTNKGSSIIARNLMIQNALDAFAPAKGEMRAMMVDSDIIIENPDAVAEAITVADKRGWNVTANYHKGDGSNVLCHFNGPNYTDYEIRALENYDPVEMMGFGFYYGTFWRSYTFHCDQYPEDYYFCREMPVNPRLAKNISFKHLQTIPV